MLGRRRHPRFQLAQPLEGSVLVREEVSIEQWSGNELIVLSPEPCRPRERLRIEFPDRSRRRCRALVVESRPLMADDGVIRHRLKLTLESESAEVVRV
jgi:hypothetical protein